MMVAQTRPVLPLWLIGWKRKLTPPFSAALRGSMACLSQNCGKR
jgi:hypothetical protein